MALSVVSYNTSDKITLYLPLVVHVCVNKTLVHSATDVHVKKHLRSIVVIDTD